MEPIQVAVVNQSSRDDEDVARGVAALQKQISEDFAPVWHMDARLQLVRKDCAAERRPNAWGLILLDQEGDARRLGYHDLTSSGLPLSKVFVNRIGKGRDWTHTASHELLEMLADPDINLAAYSRPDALTQFMYAREVCDPCAAYEDGYEVLERWVSDFTFPAWFQPDALTRFKNPTTRTRFDERGLIKAPFELRPGGYIGVFDSSISAWRMLTSTDGPNGGTGEVDEPADVGSRMERRSTARNRWLTSDYSWGP